jgi:hypothetical protein
MSIIASANESLHQNVLLEYAQTIDMSEELTQVRIFGIHLLSSSLLIVIVDGKSFSV